MPCAFKKKKKIKILIPILRNRCLTVTHRLGDQQQWEALICEVFLAFYIPRSIFSYVEYCRLNIEEMFHSRCQSCSDFVSFHFFQN